jgi:acyl-CoA reductase-like NAD-dependent aldehyde dehydrogenase
MEFSYYNNHKKSGCSTSRWLYHCLEAGRQNAVSCLVQAVLAKEAGFPKGTINVVTTLLVTEVGQELCTNRIVKKLSFAGSTRVGKLLA